MPTAVPTLLPHPGDCDCGHDHGWLDGLHRGLDCACSREPRRSLRRVGSSHDRLLHEHRRDAARRHVGDGPFRYVAVVFAIVVGFLVWGDVPDLPTLIGSAIIIAAGLYTLYREHKLARSGGP